MNIADPIALLKMELQQTAVPQIIDLLSASIADGRPLHEVERGLWDLVLQVGRRSLGAFLDRHGTGDLGETVTLPDGHEARRLEGLHARRYVSIFGAFTLQRTVYGSREDKPWNSCPWTIVCNCLQASSPMCCKIGISPWPWSKPSAK